MIDEPEEKATIRAYLTLITGAVTYDDGAQPSEYRFTSKRELYAIKKQLKLLGCVRPKKSLEKRHVEINNILHLVYKDEEVLLYDKEVSKYRLFQLYAAINEEGVPVYN